MPGEVLIALARWAGPRVAAALLPIEERVLGPEHPATLATRDNLAYWTKQSGKKAEESPGGMK